MFVCDLPVVRIALASFIGDAWAQEWNMLKDGGVGVITTGVKNFPSVYLEGETFEIDEICIDSEFAGDLLEETKKAAEMYYENEEMNGLQDIYSAMGYIAPNSSEDGILEFEKLPDDRFAVKNNVQTRTFNSNKFVLSLFGM